jgi:putative transposase
MQNNQNRRQRRSVRLRGWNYASAGLYSVTICVHAKECVFGEVERGEVRLSEVGRIAEVCLLAIPEHHARAVLDAYVVMPNHIHAIIGLCGEAPERSDPFRPGSASLPVVVGSFKAAATRLVRRQGYPEFRWQRGYHEHVIRSERALRAIRQYIEENPLRWTLDRENPDNDRAG